MLYSQVEDTSLCNLGGFLLFQHTREYRLEVITVVLATWSLTTSFTKSFGTSTDVTLANPFLRFLQERGDLGVILTREHTSYDVSELVAEAATYRLYICKDVATGKQCLLQVATDAVHSGGLERAAFVLRELKQTADLFETEYAKLDAGQLSYERLFPQVLDSFIDEGQGRRRLNVLTFSEVDDVRQLVPLSNLVTKDRLRVALPSSAWVLGRLLKLLAFAHGEGIAVRALTGGNVLLEPSRHFAIVFDWSASLTHPGEVPADLRKDDIASAAKTVFAAIGGDLATGDFPYDGECQYLEFLQRLANHREGNAERAHEEFYQLVEKLWGRKFRPFETLPL